MPGIGPDIDTDPRVDHSPDCSGGNRPPRQQGTPKIPPSWTCEVRTRATGECSPQELRGPVDGKSRDARPVEERSVVPTRRSTATTGAMWRAGSRSSSLRQAPRMSRRRRPLPSSLRWKVFTASEARAAGVSGSRLLAGDLIRIDHGLYARSGRPADASISSAPSTGSAPGDAGCVAPRAVSVDSVVDDPTTDRDGPPMAVASRSADSGTDAVREADVIRALQRADPDAVVCGLSAARLWGLPLPLEHSAWDREELDARITMNRSGIHRPRRGLVEWRSCAIAPAERTRVKGILTTSRLRTYLDLADVLPQDDLVAIGDHLVRIPRPSMEGRSMPHVEVSRLVDAVGRFKGRGARRLRSAMADVRVGADSPPETALRLALQRAGLPEPLLNITIHQDGRWLGDPDLAWREWKVCAEYDGRPHRTRRQQAKDVRRGERRRLAGWTELIITGEDMVDDAAQAIDRVRGELLRQGLGSLGTHRLQ